MMRAALLFLATCQSALAYLPGVSPVDYEPGNILDLKVTAMTSSETELPYDYYSLAYCKPKKLHNENDNLGEFLSGERIEKSDYKIFVMQNDDCRILCKKDLSVHAQNDFVERIEENYLNHWIVDNLPAASLVHSEGTDEDEVKKTLSYQKGFPLGYKDELNSVYLFNHFSITLQYHEVREARFRIVGFKVEPYSVLHEFYSSPGWTTYDPNDAPAFKNCPGTYSSVTEWSRFKLDTTKTKTVIFTYDVHFEESNTEWASRWDVYLESNVSAKVHWFSIANSLLIVVLMSTMIILILVRSLRKDIHRYTRVPTDEDKADAEEDRGWKLVHGDVFRPPQQYRLLLCVLLGSGAQVLVCMFVTIWFAAMGFLSPAYRGSYIIGALFTYVLASSVAGYVSAVFFKNFGGLAWKYNTLLTAFLFPVALFLIFLVVNVTLSVYNSTGAVPFTTLLVLIFLWFFVSVPLTFLGSYFGYKKPKWEYPMGINMTKREIPPAPLLAQGWFAIFVGGLLPFGSCFTELYFIMGSIWANNYYYMFGFLAIVFTILVITCAEIAILCVYFQLTSENWAWWWRAFLTPATCGLYLFLYSIWYFSTLDGSMYVTYFIYFTYMGVASFGVALACGFIGVISSLLFIIQIYASIKVD
mmetsp:Transcript_1017/g.4352  ORF Transcript_1017/g.4352 Transcript_1017/m.4352 type:complete len:641 (-) Transcript_1017:1261-3183(-)